MPVTATKSKEDPLEPESQWVKKQQVDAFKQDLLRRFDPIHLGGEGSRLGEYSKAASLKLNQDRKTDEKGKVCHKTALGADKCRNDALSQKLVRAVEITEKRIFKAAIPPMRVAGGALDWVGEVVHKQVSAACHADRYTEAACLQVADVAVAGLHFLRDHTPVGPAVREYKKYRDVDFPKFMEEVGVSQKDASQFISDVTNVGVTVLLMGSSKVVPKTLKTIHPEPLLRLPSYSLVPVAAKAIAGKAPLSLPCYAIVPVVSKALPVAAVATKAIAPVALPAVAGVVKAQAIGQFFQLGLSLPAAARVVNTQAIGQFFQLGSSLSSSTLPLEFKIVPREPIALKDGMYHLTRRIALSVEISLLESGTSIAYIEYIQNLGKRRGYTIKTIEKIKAWALEKKANRLILEAEFPENKRLFQFFLNRFQYLGSHQKNHRGFGSTDPEYAIHQFEIPLRPIKEFPVARKLTSEILKVHRVARALKTNVFAHDALEQWAPKLLAHVPVYGQNAVTKNEVAIWRDAIFQQTGKPALGEAQYFKKDSRNTVVKIDNFLIKDSAKPLEIFEEIAGLKLIDSLHLEHSITGKILAVGSYGSRTFLVRENIEGPTLLEEFGKLGAMTPDSSDRNDFFISLLKKVRLMGVSLAEVQLNGLSSKPTDSLAAVPVMISIQFYLNAANQFLTQEERELWIPSRERIDEIIRNFTENDLGPLTVGFVDVHPGQFVFPKRPVMGIIDTAYWTQAISSTREPRTFPLYELFRFLNQFKIHGRKSGMLPEEVTRCENTLLKAWRSNYKDYQSLDTSTEIFNLLANLVFLHDVHTQYDSWPPQLGDRKQYIEESLRTTGSTNTP